MNNDNRKKVKNPALAEIEEEAPVLPKEPEVPEKEDVPTVPVLKVEDLLTKDPETLSAEEMDFLSENSDDLTDELKVKYGLADPEILDPEEKKQPIPEPTPEPEKPTEASDQLKEQRREAQIISAQNKKITETIDQAANLTDPTEEDLIKAAKMDGANWDELTEFEKTLFKKNYINDRRFSMVHEVTKDIRQIDEWANKVDSFLEEEETKQDYKQLSGHEAQFRSFAMSESHRGVELDLLVNAFVNKLPPTVKKSGSLFPMGGGEAPIKPKGDTLTDADQVSKLKQSDPKEYARLLKAGKIKIEV